MSADYQLPQDINVGEFFQKVIDAFSQSGILDSFHPEGSEPVFRINNRDLLNEKIASIQLLVELRDLEKKIME